MPAPVTKKVRFNVTPDRQETADVVPDLPAVGGWFDGRLVYALWPVIPEEPQPDPSVYAWSIWAACLVGEIDPVYMAVHEPESEIF